MAKSRQVSGKKVCKTVTINKLTKIHLEVYGEFEVDIRKENT